MGGRTRGPRLCGRRARGRARVRSRGLLLGARRAQRMGRAPPMHPRTRTPRCKAGGEQSGVG